MHKVLSKDTLSKVCGGLTAQEKYCKGAGKPVNCDVPPAEAKKVTDLHNAQ